MIRKFPFTSPNLFIGVSKRLDTRREESDAITKLTLYYYIDEFCPSRINPWFFNGGVILAKDYLRAALAATGHKMEQSQAQMASLDVDNRSNVANAYCLFQT